MHVKRLYRPTVQEALAAAREELGPSALVLSTEFVPAPGWRGWVGQRAVRLTAATERPENDTSLEAAEAVEAPLVSAPRRAVTAARHLEPSGPRAGIVARLTAAGLDPVFSRAVAMRITDAACRGGSDQAVRRALAEELDAMSGVDRDYARFEVFVGPPGVGKTTTIAKIAAQECAAGGPPLGLVAADAFRAGAIEQLQSYGNILGVPVRLARGVSDFEEALAGMRRPALVDTAGRPPSDASIQGLFDVLARKRSVRTHLVLAADTSAASTERLLDRYADLNPSRIVITKLDETESMMPMLDAVRASGIPVSYLTTGQHVPDDLWRATPSNLASAVLHESTMEAPTCH